MSLYFFFLFTATATTYIYTLSLHDALPILYRNDGFCPLGNAGFNQVGIDAVRIRQDIYHDRESSGEQDGAGRRDKDRKSTRLNSSHRTISYAVFCLKKKIIQIEK